MKKKVLIIEDEINITELIKYNLEKEGYETICGRDGLEGGMLVYKERPDIVLLDVMLPKKDGFSLCREIRKDGIKTPIIMLTSKGEEKDKILGLDFGADDYITKPFSIKELTARIRAILRRSENEEEKEGIQDGKPKKHSDLEVNENEKQVYVNRMSANLTLKEFELLAFLINNQGKIFSRDELLNEVWGIDYIGESRTVDVHIRHIRQKLDKIHKGIEYIETIRGRGYRIDES